MSSATIFPCIKISNLATCSSSSSSTTTFRFSATKPSIVTIRSSQADGPLRRPVATTPAPPSRPSASPPPKPVAVAAVEDSKKSVVTMEFQRQKAKELQEYFKQKKLEEANQAPFFGFIGKNEISNGRWAMFGFAVGMLTEYATGSDFVDQMMQLAMSGTRMTGLVVVLLMLTGDHYATAGSSNYLLLPTQKDNVNANLPTVTLTTVGITRQIFNNFVDAVRDLVVSGPPVHGLLRLRDRSTVPISQRFILVELYNYEATPITLAIDVTNLYVVGYRTGDLFYYFLDSAVDTPGIFRELPHIELPFNSSYPALQHEAGDRVNIPLGITELDQSIQDLRHYRRPNLARSFIVVIQMVSEAVRFRYIENLVVLSIRADGSRQNFRPTRTMISLENNWDTLSTSIQQSVEGRFTPSVELVNREDQSVLVSSVTPGLILNIAVMIFVCNNPNPNQLISPMRHVNVDHVMGINDDHICSIIPEPTIRISGRNGLCADVKDRSFHDGNPIILFPCKSNEDENQLWTLKTDGTIRSNGKCMTAYGFKARQYVMIYNCATAVPTATKWQVWGNGTIINPESGLVLTAGLGSSRTELTVDNNIYDSRQGWLLSNNTAPIVTPIIGFKDLCLQSNYGNTVWIEECVSNKITQEWAIYPDGTIRPNGNKDNCLTWESYPRGENVVIDPCDGGAGQRWMFTIDGSISNLGTGYVVDVKRSNLNLRQIIVYPFYNTANQIWRSWLL